MIKQLREVGRSNTLAIDEPILAHPGPEVDAHVRLTGK